jgi:hypothetical protein
VNDHQVPNEGNAGYAEPATVDVRGTSSPPARGRLSFGFEVKFILGVGPHSATMRRGSGVIVMLTGMIRSTEDLLGYYDQ